MRPEDPTNDNDHDLLDRVDQAIYEAMAGTQYLAPERRYLQYLPLLHSPSTLELFGLTLNSDAYTRSVDEATQTRLWTAGNELRVTLRHFDLDYVVVNYWSPVDSRRHSVVLRRPPATVAHELYALLFYALTFEGPTRRQKRRQLMHFIGQESPRKPSLALVYEFDAMSKAGVQTVPATLLSLGDSLREALHELLGCQSLIQDLKQTSLRAVVQKALSALLANESKSAWQPLLDQLFPHQTVESLLDTFEARVEDCYLKHKDEIDSLTATLRQSLHTPALTEADTCFMLATNLIWRLACPTRITYAFPTRVLNTSCILTVGASQALRGDEWMRLRAFARSLFVNPLAHDAGVLTAKVEARERTIHHYGHTMGHRISPVVAYLQRHAPEHEAASCARMISHMSVLLQAYAVQGPEEFFKINATKSGRFVDYDCSLDLMGLMNDIGPIARQEVDEGDRVVLRYPLIEWDLSSAEITRELTDPETESSCRLHEAFFAELFGEILNNAVRHGYRLRRDEDDGTRAGVRVRVGRMTLNDQLAMVVSNYFTERRKSRPSFFTRAWLRWPRERENDGPGMAISVLRAIGAGDLWVKCDPPAGAEAGVVHVAVRLVGLQTSEDQEARDQNR